MSNFCLNYLMVMFFGGGILLFFLSIMAFCDLNGFHLKNGNYGKAGIIILINSLLYELITIALFKYKHRKIEKKEIKESVLELPEFNNDRFSLRLNKNDIINDESSISNS